MNKQISIIHTLEVIKEIILSHLPYSKYVEAAIYEQDPWQPSITFRIACVIKRNSEFVGYDYLSCTFDRRIFSQPNVMEIIRPQLNALNEQIQAHYYSEIFDELMKETLTSTPS